MENGKWAAHKAVHFFLSLRAALAIAVVFASAGRAQDIPPAPAWLSIGVGTGLRGGFLQWHVGGWLSPGQLAVGLRQSGIIPDNRSDGPLETSAFFGWHGRNTNFAAVVAVGLTIFSTRSQGAAGCAVNCAERHLFSTAAPTTTIEITSARESNGLGVAVTGIGGKYGYAAASFFVKIVLPERWR